MTTDVIYQSNHHFVVGKGPKTCGMIGCVECASTMILRDLGVCPDLMPEEFNANALVDGAFEEFAQSIDVAIAMKRYAVKCEDRVFEGLPYERGRIMGSGGRCLVRVAFADDNEGDHTIAGVGIDKDGSLHCLDPAIGHVTIRPDLKQENLSWGKHDDGSPNIKTYRVVNLRGIFKVG